MFDRHDSREPEDAAFVQCIRDGNHETTEIARTLGIPKQQAVERLRDLRRDDRVEMSVRGNSLSWWLVDA